jgi:hypothetical protein
VSITNSGVRQTNVKYRWFRQFLNVPTGTKKNFFYFVNFCVDYEFGCAAISFVKMLFVFLLIFIRASCPTYLIPYFSNTSNVWLRVQKYKVIRRIIISLFL